jgi:hypothetical protein
MTVAQSPPLILEIPESQLLQNSGNAVKPEFWSLLTENRFNEQGRGDVRIHERLATASR